MGYFADCGSQTSISQEDASRSQIDTLHRPPAACSHSRQLFRPPASRAETRERHEKAGGMGRGNSQQPKLRMARITRKGKVGRSRRDRRDRTAPSPQRATEEHRETAKTVNYERHELHERESIHSRDEPQRAAEAHGENSWGELRPGNGSERLFNPSMLAVSLCSSVALCGEGAVRSRRSRRDRPTFPFREIRAIRSFGCWAVPFASWRLGVRNSSAVLSCNSCHS